MKTPDQNHTVGAGLCVCPDNDGEPGISAQNMVITNFCLDRRKE